MNKERSLGTTGKQDFRIKHTKKKNNKKKMFTIYTPHDMNLIHVVVAVISMYMSLVSLFVTIAQSVVLLTAWWLVG